MLSQAMLAQASEISPSAFFFYQNPNRDQIYPLCSPLSFLSLLSVAWLKRWAGVTQVKTLWPPLYFTLLHMVHMIHIPLFRWILLLFLSHLVLLVKIDLLVHWSYFLLTSAFSGALHSHILVLLLTSQPVYYAYTQAFWHQTVAVWDSNEICVETTVVVDTLGPARVWPHG